MWMMVSRPLVILFGVLTAAAAALVAAQLPPTNAASDTLMYFVFIVMACQAVMGVGCIVAGVWGPMHRWLEHRAAPH
jgi:hypothetical protein